MIKLNDPYFLDIENNGKNLRLVVYANGVEKVCRKTTHKSLSALIQSCENHLFKGRLQLFRNPEEISVVVKGEVVGEITADTLLNCLKFDQQ
ncbi:hypothetical protein [Mucilaginibacter gotjawali]|uniref:Uncharacterized protein n=2 Tax=Mucilaginibacter gotjawali TaxID=1550579 RepID=A0A110B455_9SPHI|nr:hypothetical protein [Mucilaginibacter gotjawali]MBB3056958.1 hypothetical protein [Mucilaginibacter gotjawali]BAU56037.1 hypothetical protein MgSA37_04229 [Mucilaginibacter gotjawali]